MSSDRFDREMRAANPVAKLEARRRSTSPPEKRSSAGSVIAEPALAGEPEAPRRAISTASLWLRPARRRGRRRRGRRGLPARRRRPLRSRRRRPTGPSSSASPSRRRCCCSKARAGGSRTSTEAQGPQRRQDRGRWNSSPAGRSPTNRFAITRQQQDRDGASPGCSRRRCASAGSNSPGARAASRKPIRDRPSKCRTPTASAGSSCRSWKRPLRSTRGPRSTSTRAAPATAR